MEFTVLGVVQNLHLLCILMKIQIAAKSNMCNNIVQSVSELNDGLGYIQGWK
jgi:hypothetical protein